MTKKTNIPQTTTKRLEGKTALITGASRGIGAAVAREFARQGAHVILVARSLKNLEAMDDAIREETGQRATLIPLDLMDVDKIDAMVATIAERFGSLDILVGAAGMLGGLRPINSYPNKLWEQTMKLNVEANFRLLRACDGLLRKSPAGRVIMITAGAARNVMPFWGLIAISKSALETMVITYAVESSNTTVKANLVDPGEIDTKFLREAYPGIPEKSTLPQPDSIAHHFVALAEDACKYNARVIKLSPKGLEAHVAI